MVLFKIANNNKKERKKYIDPYLTGSVALGGTGSYFAKKYFDTDIKEKMGENVKRLFNNLDQLNGEHNMYGDWAKSLNKLVTTVRSLSNHENATDNQAKKIINSLVEKHIHKIDPALHFYSKDEEEFIKKEVKDALFGVYKNKGEPDKYLNELKNIKARNRNAAIALTLSGVGLGLYGAHKAASGKDKDNKYNRLTATAPLLIGSFAGLGLNGKALYELMVNKNLGKFKKYTYASLPLTITGFAASQILKKRERNKQYDR